MTAIRTRSARVLAHGGADAVRWEEFPKPTPGPGEVVVAVKAAGMNHLDLWVRRGVPGHRFPLPLTLGSDGAGVVAACGAGVAGIPVGSEVIIVPGICCGNCVYCTSGRDTLCSAFGILGETRDGTCAEFVLVPAVNVVPKPPLLGFVEAGSFLLAALTAWTMLIDRAQLRPGDDLLVIAAGSGVGSLAVQIGRLQGCRVIATAGGSAKCEKLRALGADEVIDHSVEAIDVRVKSITNRRGVDVVFEHVGAKTWEASLRSLARGGRLVTCGATSGAEAQLDLRHLFFKNLAVMGSTMGPRSTVPLLVRLLEDGKLKPLVGAVMPMERVADAHRLLEEKAVFGKVVLVTGNEMRS